MVEAGNHVGEHSESGGRLNIYRNIKRDLATESYVANERPVGVRRVLAGLRAGCLLLGVETGQHTGTPYCQRTCHLCDLGEVENQQHCCCHINNKFIYIFEPVLNISTKHLETCMVYLLACGLKLDIQMFKHVQYGMAQYNVYV